ncbi:GNAT family N-acetyltransferase [Spirosoma harenae]
MNFLRINQQHPYLTTIQHWYEETFPIDERRSFEDLVTLLSSPDMHLCALVENDQLVGFLIYWQWDEFLFLEHLAVAQEQRGKQFGQQALARLSQISTPYFILEVERPVDEISQRRIRFYERAGFALNPYNYRQPPYQPEKAAVPMWLMSIPKLPDELAYTRLSKLIEERVYRRFYRKS